MRKLISWGIKLLTSGFFFSLSLNVALSMKNQSIDGAVRQSVHTFKAEYSVQLTKLNVVLVYPALLQPLPLMQELPDNAE
jgi:hypothetical protein